MPIGILTDDEFEVEIEKANKISKVNIPLPIIKENNSGRRIDDKEVGESVRKVIASEIIERGNAKLVAAQYGISESSVNAYKNGATSTARIGIAPDVSLTKHVVNVRERIVKKASKRLNLALDGITEDKLANASLRESSAVARDMAAIIREMSPSENEGGNKMNVQFVLHAPAIKTESEYEVIDLNER